MNATMIRLAVGALTIVLAGAGFATAHASGNDQDAPSEVNVLVQAAEARLGSTFTEMQTTLDEATANGIPLADAGLTDAEYTELAAQGSNVVVPCEASHREVAEINDILGQAPGATLIVCGAHNPELATIAVAPVTKVRVADSLLSDAEKQAFLDDGFDLVGPCIGASGLLSDLLSSVGGDGWSCGYSSKTDS